MKSRLLQLLLTWRRHWPPYVAEAAGLAFFVTASSLITLGLEHPAPLLHQLLLAHGVGPLLGVGMSLVLVIITRTNGCRVSPNHVQSVGKRLGAHINPAVTLAFWQLGYIREVDACWYVLA